MYIYLVLFDVTEDSDYPKKSLVRYKSVGR